jgi:transposase
MKGVKVEEDMYKDIRQSYIDGESQRHIAQRLGISRQTVKKYCEEFEFKDGGKTFLKNLESFYNSMAESEAETYGISEG